jgi:hypothetical protein
MLAAETSAHAQPHGSSAAGSATDVRHFRQTLLWPLRLMRSRDRSGATEKPWQVLRDMNEASPWREVVKEYTGESADFHERHYNEFVTFLPYVQRFLYGEPRRKLNAETATGSEDRSYGSPMRVFRRHDVAQVRVVTQPGLAPITLDIVHVDLYFFYDVDLVLLNVEISANDLTLRQAQELLYRFGRGYPSGWDAQGEALHCLSSVEWLDAEGKVLATSDAKQRDAFLQHVSEHRAPRTAAHWAFLLQPLVSDHSDEAGVIRYRQIEYYRMPLMGYLSVNDPKAISRNDFIRLGMVAGAGAVDESTGVCTLPYAEDHLADFEKKFCYDRFWADAGTAPNTRYLCNGHALIVVGDARAEFYACRDRGVLAQFRHQHFLLFLIAHFQKAALLMFSDRLVEALKRLEISDANSVRRFKREIRASFEGFLRFTHRYWFHEVAEQAQARALFHLCATHLDLDPLYAEVKERIHDMNEYLDADSLRRQANTVVRLTVVTIFGLIGTITTGFLGMNLIAEADASWPRKIVLAALVLIPTVALTLYTMSKSKGLSDFLDALSDERLSFWDKCKAFFSVWRRAR